MASNTKYIAIAAVVIIAGGAAAYVLSRPQPTTVQPATSATSTPTQAGAPASQPVADCLMPGPAPMPPSGKSSSAQEMQEGRDAIQVFVNQLEDYQTCREHQIATAPANVTAAQKAKWRDDGNVAVDEADALRDAFSAELKLFQARQQGS